MDTRFSTHSLTDREENVQALTWASILLAVLVGLLLTSCSRRSDTAKLSDTVKSQTAAPTTQASTQPAASYQGNIIQSTQENRNFRKVLFTGEKSQLVAMSLPPGGEIGAEAHPHVEQIIVVQSGSGRSEVDGKTTAVKAGDVLVVTSGTKHNVINTGKEDLKLYTIYTPPNHIDGRVHATKADAERDQEDEAFGADVKD